MLEKNTTPWEGRRYTDKMSNEMDIVGVLFIMPSSAHSKRNLLEALVSAFFNRIRL